MLNGLSLQQQPFVSTTFLRSYCADITPRIVGYMTVALSNVNFYDIIQQRTISSRALFGTDPLRLSQSLILNAQRATVFSISV